MSETTVTHALYRVHLDGELEYVSEHPDFTSGWSAGTAAVHEDRDHAYALYANCQRVARFGYARVANRQPQANLDTLAMLGSLS